MSWAAVIVGGVSLGVGIYQMVDGNNKAKKNRENTPVYEVPEEIYANMSAAERLAYEGMPAAQKAQFNKTIQRQQASMLSRSGSLQAGLSGLAASTQAGADAAGNLAVADAQMRREGEQIAMSQRGILAQYKDKAFNIERSDWMYDRDVAEAQKAAGMQNIYNAMDIGASRIGAGSGQGSGQGSARTTQEQPFQFTYSYNSTPQMRDQLNPGGYPISSEVLPTLETMPNWGGS